MTDIMTVRELVSVARTAATIAHLGQTDKVGEKYISHPEAVAKIVSESTKDLGDADRSEHIAVAWLHDVLEDTDLTDSDLTALGFPYRVIRAVKLLTRSPNIEPDDYYGAIRQDGYNASGGVALRVKRADIQHNTDPRRLAKLDDETQLRLIKKYANALEKLA